MNTLIIQSPHNQGILRKYTQNSMTTMLWVLWIYLLLPILSPLLILIGHDIQTISQVERSLNIKQFIAVFPLVFIMFTSCWLWSKYNTLLYHRRNKKSRGKRIQKNESLNYFSIPAKEQAYWQQLKRVTVNLSEQGGISCVKEHKLAQLSNYYVNH